VHPEDRERVRAGVNWALQGGGDYVVEYRIVLSDGSMHWLVTRARVEIDSDGLPARVRGVSIDITERKLVDEALRESEARFRTMANTAPVMIWMSGTDKLCTFFNKGWLNFTGRTLEQELGNGWAAGVHPDDFDNCVEMHVNAFDARQEFTMEYRLRRFDGEYCWVLGHGVPRFESDGTFLGYIGTAIDITERKRAESELRRQREELAHMNRVSTMGELSASLAHELNQPLTAILSNAQAAQRFLAAQPAAVKELREILKDIVQDDSRASAVIHRMRALVKKQEIAFVPIDLSGVIRDVAALVHSDALLHNIRVLLEPDPRLPLVQGDKVELQQVVLNMLLNAFEAMKDCPANQREINVGAELDGADVVRVVVRDHGTGMSSENLDKIFQPFYTTKRDGLGMGLSISRSIIEAHGGRLWAENNLDRGATFYFTVPVVGLAEKE
jgi:PAS domain S-box-containing protein